MPLRHPARFHSFLAATAVVTCTVVLLFGLPSCGVPDVTFVTDEGGTADAPPLDPQLADGSKAADGGAKAMADAAPEAASDAPEASALGCPNVVPPGAITCCGTVPCVAPNTGKCMNECAMCEQACADAGLTCCLHPNGSFNGCGPSPSMCP